MSHDQLRRAAEDLARARERVEALLGEAHSTPSDALDPNANRRRLAADLHNTITLRATRKAEADATERADEAAKRAVFADVLGAAYAASRSTTTPGA